LEKGAQVERMAEDPDNRELAHQFALLEARMDTQLAKNESAIDRLRADMEKRDKDNQRWIVGFGVAQLVITIAVIAAGFAFFGILIGLPR